MTCRNTETGHGVFLQLLMVMRSSELVSSDPIRSRLFARLARRANTCQRNYSIWDEPAEPEVYGRRQT